MRIILISIFIALLFLCLGVGISTPKKKTIKLLETEVRVVEENRTSQKAELDCLHEETFLLIENTQKLQQLIKEKSNVRTTSRTSSRRQPH